MTEQEIEVLKQALEIAERRHEKGLEDAIREVLEHPGPDSADNKHVR